MLDIDDCSFLLADDVVAGVEEAIVGAVHDGGGFVELPAVDELPTRVLITTGSSVRFQPVPHPTVPDDAGEEWERTFADLDWL